VAMMTSLGSLALSKMSWQNCSSRMSPVEFTDLFPVWYFVSIIPPKEVWGMNPEMSSSHHVGWATPRGGRMVSASGLRDISCRHGNNKISSFFLFLFEDSFLTAVAMKRSANPMAAVEMARRKFDDTTVDDGLLSSPTANNNLTARSSSGVPLEPNRIFSFLRNLRNPSACPTPFWLSAESKNQL